MTDDLRALFDDSAEGIPVADTRLDMVRSRARALARRRVAALVLAAAAVLGTGAFAAVELDDGNRPVTPPSNDETPRRLDDVDRTALEVIDRLGPQCRGYDFYYKSEFEGGVYRPVQCDMRTASPSSTSPASADASPSPSPT
ncbi:MAG TPA: hypothetical protein VIG64_04245, partial [Actinomycetota bacterium]